MRRPAEQTKLFFVYFLRSTAAALATRGTSPSTSLSNSVGPSNIGASNIGNSIGSHARGISSAAPSTEASSVLCEGHIAFRLARRSDVPQIQRCNLATLPENYNLNFYANHMRQWPELALVAEHIPPGDHGDDINDVGQQYSPPGRRSPDDISSISSFRRANSRQRQQQPQKEIVGYILGKVDERHVRQYRPPSRHLFSRSSITREDEGLLLQYMDQDRRRHQAGNNSHNNNIEVLGHVTSLAVMSNARRLGIATHLLHQLHFHLQECYAANAVGLHVRISNRAAVKLYCEHMGYDVADIIPGYYADGEDAYFMRKDFVPKPLLDNDVTAIRQTEMDEEQRAWYNRDWRRGPSSSSTSSSPSSSFSGAHQSFKNLWTSSGQKSSPWETGPEQLRLPRYSKVIRPNTSPPTATNGQNTKTGSNIGLKSRVSNHTIINQQHHQQHQQQRDDDEDSYSYETQIASGSL